LLVEQYGFGLWTWPLEASHYDCLSEEAIGVSGQTLGESKETPIKESISLGFHPNFGYNLLTWIARV